MEVSVVMTRSFRVGVCAPPHLLGTRGGARILMIAEEGSRLLSVCVCGWLSLLAFSTRTARERAEPQDDVMILRKVSLLCAERPAHINLPKNLQQSKYSSHALVGAR